PDLVRKSRTHLPGNAGQVDKRAYDRSEPWGGPVMPASRKTSFIDQDQFLQLRRAGHSYGAIGRQTGGARETVRKYCRAAGRPAAKLGRPAGCLRSFDPLV